MASNNLEDACHSVILEENGPRQDETVVSTLDISLELIWPVLTDQVDEKTVGSTLEIDSELGLAVSADQIDEENAVVSTLDINSELSSPVSVDQVDEETAGSTLQMISELILTVRVDQVDEQPGCELPSTVVTTLGDKRLGSGDSSETDHSNDKIFDDNNEEQQPAQSTHHGQPWESDSEEDDSDSDCDAGQLGSDKNDGAVSSEKTGITYKTAFGTITLLKDLSQDLDNNPATIDEEPQASVTAPLEPITKPESFQNEFYEVKRSPTAGFGSFALRKLVKGQTILIEKSLFHADNYSLRDEINKLPPDLRRAFERMHGNGAREDAGKHEQRAAIFKTNSFFVNRWDSGVFLVASKFNNACHEKKNVAYVYDQCHDCMVFTVEQDTEAGQELFITYGKDPKTLYTQYGFVCRCGGCASLTEAEVEQIKNPGW